MIMARYYNVYAGVMMISYEELAIICHRHSGYETAQLSRFAKAGASEAAAGG